MIHIKTSPSLANATTCMSIILSLSTQLAGRKEFAAICIKNAIASNMPAATIICTVKDMIMDNPDNMSALIDEGLAVKILKL